MSDNLEFSKVTTYETRAAVALSLLSQDVRGKNNLEESTTRYAMLMLAHYFPNASWNFVPQYRTEGKKYPDLACENFVYKPQEELALFVP
jgi:hypothetical protein